MPQYYNKSRGPLPVTLRGGKSATLAGKSWTEIAVEDEGSEDLQKALKQGLLTRYEAPVEVAPPVEAEPAEDKSTKVAPAAAEEKSVTEKSSDLPRRRKA